LVSHQETRNKIDSIRRHRDAAAALGEWKAHHNFERVVAADGAKRTIDYQARSSSGDRGRVLARANIGMTASDRRVPKGD